jgi:gamma-carbonic anhydrase
MKPGLPSIHHRLRQIVGRALRETGQALDQCAIRIRDWATTEREFGDDPVIWEDHLNRHRTYMPLLFRGEPLVHDEVSYIAPCSTLIGSVRVHKDASIWYGAILRGDVIQNGQSWHYTKEENLYAIPDTEEFNRREASGMAEKTFAELGGIVMIGEGSNVQDGCLIDAHHGHTIIGKGVTIGHLAHIHSASVGDYSLIGMGSLLNRGVVVESEAMVAAGAVVARDTLVGSGELWVGNPARKIRDLTEAERQKLHYQSAEYIKVARNQRGVMELGGNVASLLNIPKDALLDDGAEQPEQSLDKIKSANVEPDEKPTSPTSSS